jgi:hypothetical protein
MEPKSRASATPDVEEAHIAPRNKIITFLGLYRGACIWTFWPCLAFEAPSDPVDTASQAALTPDPLVEPEASSDAPFIVM